MGGLPLGAQHEWGDGIDAALREHRLRFGHVVVPLLRDGLDYGPLGRVLLHVLGAVNPRHELEEAGVG